MSLFNQHWIGFDGEPVTGKVPPRMVIHAAPGTTLTPEQEGAVAHAFKLFTDAVKVSPHAGMYHSQRRKLADGSLTRMTSNSGLDLVEVWPAGADVSSEIQDLFLGIPSSLSFRTGYSPPEWPSGTPGPTGRWWNYLREQPPGALSPGFATIYHPGHITWSSAGFVAEDREVQLSWRGPDSRYATSTGWSGATGGTIIAHGDGASIIGPYLVVYKDSSTVWINGRAIDTGVEKVIAAALHRPEPETKPSHVVLRVCSDNYPQPSDTRGLVVYDLVPQDVGVDPDNCTLAQILGASSTIAFGKVGTYPATNFKASISSADVGKFSHFQRPHFDSKGARLATSILTPSDVSGGVGYTGAVFALPGWGIVQQVWLPSSNYTNSTETRDYTLDGGGYVASIDRHIDYAIGSSITSLIAIDFLRSDTPGTDDDVVYVTMTETSARTSVTDYAETAEVGGTTVGYTMSSSVSDTVNIGVVANHSKHGELLNYSYIQNSGNSGALSHTAPFTYSGSASSTAGGDVFRGVSFVGDLSRDVFAIGWSEEVLQTPVTISGDLIGPNGSGNFSIDASGVYAKRNPLFKYDVHFAGAMTAGAVDGGKVDYWSEGDLTESAPYTDDWGSTTRVFLDGPPTAPPAPTSIASSSQYGAAGELTARRYGHAAVDATRKVAYLGISHYTGGLDLIAREAASTLPVIEAVPPYAPGDLPTLAAPIFLGPMPKPKSPA